MRTPRRWVTRRVYHHVAATTPPQRMVVLQVREHDDGKTSVDALPVVSIRHAVVTPWTKQGGDSDPFLSSVDADQLRRDGWKVKFPGMAEVIEPIVSHPDYGLVGSWELTQFSDGVVEHHLVTCTWPTHEDRERLSAIGRKLLLMPDRVVSQDLDLVEVGPVAEALQM